MSQARKKENNPYVVLNSIFLVSYSYVFVLISKMFIFQVSYHITYTDAGEIIEAAASFVLGAINKEVLSIQQSFEISFTQVTARDVTDDLLKDI